MSELLIGTCSSCRHSAMRDQTGGTITRVCILNPPTATFVNNPQGQLMLIGIWPPVGEQGSCSKHEALQAAGRGLVA